jgi:hypothetical protein
MSAAANRWCSERNVAVTHMSRRIPSLALRSAQLNDWLREKRMKKYVAVTVAGLAGLAVLPENARAESNAPPPDLNVVQMNVQIGNETFSDIELNWGAVTDPVTGETRYRLWGSPPPLQTSDGSQFVIGGSWFDPDPVMFFSGSATNNSNAPLVFTFSFNAPMSPALLGSINSHAELGVTLTDGFDDGATVQALAGSKMLKSYDLFASGGSISKNVDLGTAFSIFSGTSGTTFSADSSLVCAVACTTMSAVMQFTLTAKDSVAFTGKVVQNVAPVPVPAAFWLLGSGIAGLMGMRRRRIAR